MKPRWRFAVVPIVALVVLAAGAAARFAGNDSAAGRIWFVGLLITGAPLVWQTVRSARQGHFATDIVASFSIIGAAALDQPVAGLVIVLMQSGGVLLERLAEGRASAAVRELEAAAPRIAHRVVGDVVTDVAVAAVAVGDLLMIRPGELVPCDGVVVEGFSDLNTAALTGEPLPVDGRPGTALMSGTLNGAGLLRVRAGATAQESQYARIVDMVRDAQAGKAPVQRLADRYAVWFTPITIAVCAITLLFTHDWMRVLAVLVVATPCPLILAAPIGVIGGINRAARRGVILRNGNALEQLARIDTAVFDKTGTITVGQPRLREVRAFGKRPREEVLGFAAAVEHASGHLLARVVVAAAQDEGLAIGTVTESREEPGRGVTGFVNGHTVHVGGRSFLRDHVVVGSELPADTDATLQAFVAVDGVPAGVIEFADELRHDLRETLDRLRALSVTRLMLLSGDHAPAVRTMAEAAGFGEARGDLLPGDKAATVRRLRAEGRVVMMVGDGTNDAPALSAADVGVALSAHSGGVTAEAADVVVLRDALGQVADAVEIARHAIRITRQSIWIGLGLSGCAMIGAAFGGITPVAGALLQEGIDVAVILNALRSSGPLSFRHGHEPIPH